MSLLKAGKFDQAIQFFEGHLEGNALAYYGLASAKFRKDPAHVSAALLREVGQLYEHAINLSPEFADAYFMCGMAYNALARMQLGALSSGYPVTSSSVQEADSYLTRAASYYEKAISLSPGFSKLAGDEKVRNNEFRAMLDNIKSRLGA